MFLLERIVGIATYAFFLLLICLLIARKNSHPARILKIYTIILAIMGFVYVPHITADLYRIYYSTLDYYGTLSFSQFFKRRFQPSPTPMSDLLYWLVSQTEIYQLLPFVTAIICYSCIFYIVIQTAKKYEVQRKYIALEVFFLMASSTYMFVISGIRCMLAVSLIAFCFYRETNQNIFRIWHILLYLIAALMHSYAVVIVAIRLAMPLFDRRKKGPVKMLYIAFLGVLLITSPLYATHLIEATFERAESYIQGDMYSYVWDLIIGITTFFAIFFALVSRTDEKNKRVNKSQTEIMVIVLLCIACVFFFEYSIFHRTVTYIAPLIAIPNFMEKLQKRAKVQQIFLYNIVLMLSILSLIVACTRGSLCSYKFFIL